MRLIKYWVALIWRRVLLDQMAKMTDFEGSITEEFNQRWIHIQGQCLTKGRMKWRWDKIFYKIDRQELN